MISNANKSKISAEIELNEGESDENKKEDENYGLNENPEQKENLEQNENQEQNECQEQNEYHKQIGNQELNVNYGPNENHEMNANYGPNENHELNANYGPNENHEINVNYGPNENHELNENYGPNENHELNVNYGPNENHELNVNYGPNENHEMNANYGPNENHELNENYGPNENHELNVNYGPNENHEMNANYGPNENHELNENQEQNENHAMNENQQENEVNSEDLTLNPDVLIESAEGLLYRIGLTSDTGKSPNILKRKRMFHPFLIIIINVYFIIKETIVILLCTDQDLMVFKILGSFSQPLGLRVLLSLGSIFMSIMCIGFRMIYYINYWNRIEPTFLCIFRMMSGLVSPTSLGLTNKPKITKFVKTTKFWLNLFEWNNTCISPIVGALFYFFVFAKISTSKEILFLIAPYCVITGLWSAHQISTISTLVLVFDRTCTVQRMRINALNEKLSELERNKQFSRIDGIIKQYHDLLSTIDEYNKTFWSKCLLLFWAFGLCIVVFTYPIIYTEMNPIFRLVALYFIMFWYLCFLRVLYSASTVDYCANKSYKKLNSFITSYSKYCDTNGLTMYSKRRRDVS